MTNKKLLKHNSRILGDFFKNRNLPVPIRNIKIYISRNGDYVIRRKGFRRSASICMNKFLASVSLPQKTLFNYLKLSGNEEPFSVEEKNVLSIIARASKINLKKIPFDRIRDVCT